MAAVATKEWITKGINDSRAKDYTNPYRKIVYESIGEMNAVLGKLEENSFIKQQVEELNLLKAALLLLRKNSNLNKSKMLNVNAKRLTPTMMFCVKRSAVLCVQRF
jgi:hypothetical protein